MRKIIHFALASLSFLAPDISAKNADATNEEEALGKSTNQGDRPQRRQNSRSERKSKTWEIAAGGDHLLVGGKFFPGVGSTIGYFYRPNLLFESNGRLGMNLSDPKPVTAEASLNLKLFLGNSLYLSSGGGGGVYMVTHEASDLNNNTSWKEVKYALRPFAAVGHQWQEKHWTLLIEWASLGYSLETPKPIANALPIKGEDRPEGSEEEYILNSVVGTPALGFRIMLGLAI